MHLSCDEQYNTSILRVNTTDWLLSLQYFYTVLRCGCFVIVIHSLVKLKTIKKGHKKSRRGTLLHQRRAALRRACRRRVSGPPAALITSQTKSGWIIGEKYGRWRTSLSISLAQQTSQREHDAQAARRHMLLVYWQHMDTIHSTARHTRTHTQALGVSLPRTLREQDSLSTCHQKGQLNIFSAICTAKIRTVGPDTVCVCV